MPYAYVRVDSDNLDQANNAIFRRRHPQFIIRQRIRLDVTLLLRKPQSTPTYTVVGNYMHPSTLIHQQANIYRRRAQRTIRQYKFPDTHVALTLR